MLPGPGPAASDIQQNDGRTSVSNGAPSMESTAQTHTWRFFRAGGFDQVRLDSGADLLNLDRLDQKLWLALSCPTRGLEFDPRTLALIDTDNDGHVRAPELIGAIKWAGAVLRDPELLARGAPELELSMIRDDTDDGRRLLASARQILSNLGRGGADRISVADTESSEKIFAETPFNGDGVITARSTGDEALKKLMGEIIDCLGGAPDRCGDPGVDEERVNAFFEQAQKYAAWATRPDAEAALLPLGAASADAAAALEAVRAKVDDYFTRCQLVAYDAHAAKALNGSEEDFAALAKRDLSAPAAEIGALPIAVAAPGRAMPLAEGINPAWSGAVGALRDKVVTPLLGSRQELSAQDWAGIKERFAAHGTWAAERVDTPVAKLELPRLKEILGSGAKASLAELIARDKALEAESNAITEVERLARYVRDLGVLANNYVAFRDFYTGRAKGVFQAGTLYLDGRSFELCVRVEDPGKHGVLAGLSRLYLAYCECVRGADKMTIAAAITGGDSDQLMIGRNGVFYDRQGRDWDATIVRIVEHPISIRQAFWGPYKRIIRMVGEQIQKFAASRAKAAEDKAAAGLIKSGTTAAEAKPAPAPFDVAKFAGIFAAIGLALGAIGTALAAVVTGLLQLSWWQWPLAIAAVALLISGPSMLIAWFKLRQRNLGPLLDANGWAVNARALINIPFGTSLTQLAKLPEGAERSLSDPYAEKKRPWGVYLLVIVAVAAFLAFLWVYKGRGI